MVRVDEVTFDETDLLAEPEGNVLIRLTDGPRAGEELRAFVTLPSTYMSAEDFGPGDEVIVTYTEQPDGPVFVGVAERWRLPALAVLVVLFIVAIVAVAGWHGVRALVALALTIVVTVKLLVPAILEGVPPVPLALVVAGGITVVTILLSEGLTRTSLAAILGAVDGLAVTAVVSALIGIAAGFSGAPAGELGLFEVRPGETLDLSGLLLAAIIDGDGGRPRRHDGRPNSDRRGARRGAGLPGSGAVVQRAPPRPLAHRSHDEHPLHGLRRSEPARAGLPDRPAEPVLLTLNREVLALEIVHTLAGSLGMVAAMPITTAIATMLVGPSVAQKYPDRPPPRA